MSFAMTTQGPSSILARAEMIAQFPGNSLQSADNAFTTATVNTGTLTSLVGGNTYRVKVYLKTLVLGANTNAQQGPLFYLECADNSGFSTNLTVMGGLQQAVNIASSTEVQTMEWEVRVPVASKLYARVTCDPTLMGAGSSGTFDALIENAN